jgi:hypothetical protein
VCERPGCDRPIPATARIEARYCSKRCRQAVSRQRVRNRGPVKRPERRERCAWCKQPMPAGRRGEAVFCSKGCRQASSRFGLAIKRGTQVPAEATRRSSTSEASRATSPTPAPAERPLELRRRTVELVDGLIAAEESCFGAWCDLLDSRGRVAPEAVIASQRLVSDAAARLRA